MRFQDRTCLVTGATGGIGQATCRLLAKEGARVAVAYHSDASGAEQLVGQLPGQGHASFQADLTDLEACRGLVQAVAEAMGRLDVLVNNAGLYEEHPPLKTSRAAWQQVFSKTMALNLHAPAVLAHEAAGLMAEAEQDGAIVNVSSRGAFRGEPTAPAYGASKAALNALTQSLAKALAPHSITVTAVAPGFVETPMVADLLEGAQGEAIKAQSPLERVAKPEEIAACIAFLASGEAEFTTGAILDVNGASYLRT